MATGPQAALEEAWGAKQRTRAEEAWHAAVLAAALTLALPMRGPGVLTSGPPPADEQPLVEKALQVLRGAACACAAVAIPDAARQLV